MFDFISAKNVGPGIHTCCYVSLFTSWGELFLRLYTTNSTSTYKERILPVILYRSYLCIPHTIAIFGLVLVLGGYGRRQLHLCAKVVPCCTSAREERNEIKIYFSIFFFNFIYLLKMVRENWSENEVINLCMDVLYDKFYLWCVFVNIWYDNARFCLVLWWRNVALDVKHCIKISVTIVLSVQK